ncbi:MAG TPA: hypothetical protein VI299_26135 [Polyangiales bacterium]
MFDELGEDRIDFGALPAHVNQLLQRGVAAYPRDRAAAERHFREALSVAPEQLPIYFCLYKIHTYQGRLDEALEAAQAGLREAARQAGLDPDFARWTSVSLAPEEPGRFALYTLKALAFIHLRRGERALATQVLSRLAELDPQGSVGWRVVAEMKGDDA